MDRKFFKHVPPPSKKLCHGCDGWRVVYHIRRQSKKIIIETPAEWPMEFQYKYAHTVSCTSISQKSPIKKKLIYIIIG